MGPDRWAILLTYLAQCVWNLEGGVSRWLVGVVGLGAELHPRPHTRRVCGAEYPSGLVKRAVPRPSGPDPEGHARGFGVASTVPGGGRRSKAVAFHNPQALSNAQEENLSCARDQVVIARPPVLIPP
jgi:hypothetical protein